MRDDAGTRQRPRVAGFRCAVCKRLALKYVVVKQLRTLASDDYDEEARQKDSLFMTEYNREEPPASQPTEREFIRGVEAAVEDDDEEGEYPPELPNYPQLLETIDQRLYRFTRRINALAEESVFVSISSPLQRARVPNVEQRLDAVVARIPLDLRMWEMGDAGYTYVLHRQAMDRPLLNAFTRYMRSRGVVCRRVDSGYTLTLSEASRRRWEVV